MNDFVIFPETINSIAAVTFTHIFVLRRRCDEFLFTRNFPCALKAIHFPIKKRFHSHRGVEGFDCVTQRQLTRIHRKQCNASKFPSLEIGRFFVYTFYFLHTAIQGNQNPLINRVGIDSYAQHFTN